jgi:hypothetical protein
MLYPLCSLHCLPQRSLNFERGLLPRSKHSRTGPGGKNPQTSRPLLRLMDRLEFSSPKVLKSTAAASEVEAPLSGILLNSLCSILRHQCFELHYVSELFSFPGWGDSQQQSQWMLLRARCSQRDIGRLLRIAGTRGSAISTTRSPR